METVALGISIIAVVLILAANVMLLIKAFQTSVLWGLGYMFIPFVSLVFVIKYWAETKKWFGLAVLGGLLFIGSGLLLPSETVLPE